MTTTEEQLREKLRGLLIGPADPVYDAARAVWNAAIDRRPALIVRCLGVSDVRAALAFGRERGLPIAIRGGGHNIGGLGTCDGGVVIDLGGMRSISVDPAARCAYAEGGVTLRELDHETQDFGLATPVGVNSTTGLAGLTLGGGFGWLSRRYGMTIDNLISADVVLADGRVVKASATSHSDLFWAIRGGGGNFGVVTRFELALHPVGPEVFAGAIAFSLDDAKTVLEGYRHIAADAPDDLSVWCVLRKAPPLPFLPPEQHGRPAFMLFALYLGGEERGQKLIAPLMGLARPLGHHFGMTPYTAWQRIFDPLLGPGARNYWKSHNMVELADGFIDALVDFSRRGPHPQCDMMIGHLGGRSSSVPVTATAYPHRSAQFVVNVHARWESETDDEACTAWARSFFAQTDRFAIGGSYVNFLTPDESNRVPLAYGPNYPRLARLKRRYDPDNVFKRNQNIVPAADDVVGDASPSKRSVEQGSTHRRR